MIISDVSFERLAYLFRSKNNLGLREPIIFKNLLKKLNVLTVFKPLSHGFSGMSIKSNKFKFILINCKHPIGRQHFTIAHEIYHLFVQENFTPHICDTGKFTSQQDPVERDADRFAAELILPNFGIYEQIPNLEFQRNGISLDTLLKIENEYSCSRTALLYRLKRMGLIDDDYYRKYSKSVIKSAVQNGYPKTLYEEGNHGLVIGDYGTSARALFDKGSISESHYANLMKDIGIDIEERLNDNLE